MIKIIIKTIILIYIFVFIIYLSKLDDNIVEEFNNEYNEELILSPINYQYFYNPYLNLNQKNYYNPYKKFNYYDNIYNNKYLNSWQYYKMNNIDPVGFRDYNVVNNILYPPIGRNRRPDFDNMMNLLSSNQGLFNVYTRGPPDTFSQLGLLKDQQNGSMYMLFGRSKYPGSDLGDYYITSTNKDSYFKLPLHSQNCNIRKIYDIPDVVTINDPILKSKFDFSEFKKSFDYSPYY